MSRDRRNAAAQRAVARFALAGSGAIREHGVIDRPTEDVDIFTADADEGAFSVAVDQVASQLRSSGFRVDVTRRAEHFARLHVVADEGVQLDVDLGVDWRQEEPVRLAVGPVLSLSDAVGNKVGALYSRGEVRDYLDVDAIRSSGRFKDEQLLTSAADRDPGFSLDMFLWRLDGARRISPEDVERYDVTADQLVALQSRYDRLAADLRAQASRDDSGGGVPESQERTSSQAVTATGSTGRSAEARAPSESETRRPPHPQGGAPAR